jgi:alpha-L-fucosidase
LLAVASGVQHRATPESRARDGRSMPFEPTLESLNAHAVPGWYEDAKFGIFIHWGLFSIPGFATRGGSIGDTFRDNYDTAIARTPYTELYWNAI